jgi:peptidoglycan/LPS O-acetylase OafA/YrhL
MRFFNKKGLHEDVGGSGDVAARLGYRPALDGLRGISILAVIGFNSHLSWLRGGFVGVDVFFVLSGFLITALLVQEHSRISRIRIKDFYMRRAVRLLPALFVLILFCIAYALLFQAPESASVTLKGVLYTLFYVANWAQIPPSPPGIGALSHAWSLSVEEQFYIVWPLVLLVLLKLKIRGLVFAVLTIFIATSIFLNVWFWHTGVPHLRMYFGTDTRANEILIGCVVALLLCWGVLKDTERLKWILHAASILCVGTLFISFISYRHNEAFVYNGGFVLISAATGLLIIDVLLFPSIISRCLEFAPLVWIGKVSYGLYLWHFPVFEVSRKLLEGRIDPVPHQVVGFITTLLVAAASYYLLEQPLLRLKRRNDASVSNAQLVPSSVPNA